MLQIIALQNFPEVLPGDNLAAVVTQSLRDNQQVLQQGDVLVLAQKIVSKAENQYRDLKQVKVSQEANFLSQSCGKDPRVLSLILDESKQVLRMRQGLVIVEHKLGFVHANAGIDQSNLSDDKNEDWVLLLPKDPDASAKNLASELQQTFQLEYSLAVVINDSMGRAWRNGTVGIAIGCANLRALDDRNGDPDRTGRLMKASQIALADEIAAAASLMMGQTNEGCPVVIVRNCPRVQSSDRDDINNDQGVKSLLRDAQNDLFR